MRKLVGLIALLIITSIFMCSCNMGWGIGNYNFSKIHIDTHNFQGCIMIDKWYESTSGIEVRTYEYGSLFISEGNYILVEDVCPICEE